MESAQVALSSPQIAHAASAHGGERKGNKTQGRKRRWGNLTVPMDSYSNQPIPSQQRGVIHEDPISQPCGTEQQISDPLLLWDTWGL